MARRKLALRKVMDRMSRHATFVKRRNSIMKRVHELSFLSDAEAAVIIFSPTGEMSGFSGKKSVEDVFIRYLNLPDAIRGGPPIPNKQHLLERLRRRKHERKISTQIARLEELRMEHEKLSRQLKMIQEQLRSYEPEIKKIATVEEVEKCEEFLMTQLKYLHPIKECMMSTNPSIFNYASPPTIQCIEMRPVEEKRPLPSCVNGSPLHHVMTSRVNMNASALMFPKMQEMDGYTMLSEILSAKAKTAILGNGESKGIAP